MAKLFIIGNGFDLAHGVDCQYCDFREFLYRNRRNNVIDFVDQHFSICSNWQNFEEALGYCDAEFCSAIYTAEFEAEERDNDFIGNNTLNVLENEYLKGIENLNECFQEWVDSIGINIWPEDKITDLMCREEEKYFLTFNYTETLEVTYNIESQNICHIHGYRLNEDDVIFGHGLPKKNYVEDAVLNCLAHDDSLENCEAYATNYVGVLGNYSDNIKINSSIDRIHNALRKDVSKIIQENSAFFSRLSNVTKIYSYGFSYSDVDMPYIDKIINSISNDSYTIWYFNSYDMQKINCWSNKLADLGFRGQTELFFMP